MERKIGLSSARALASASWPHGYQSTGLCACCSRYGETSCARRFVMALPQVAGHRGQGAGGVLAVPRPSAGMHSCGRDTTICALRSAPCALSWFLNRLQQLRRKRTHLEVLALQLLDLEAVEA